MGCTVVATSRSEAKRHDALTMGAAAAFDSGDRSWPVEADVVIESVGPATWEQSVRSLRPGGRLVVCGGTSGPKVELNLPRLFFKQFEIIGSTMGSYQEFEAVSTLVEHGLDVRIDRAYPLDQYDDALARLEQGEQLGKIVLTHGSPPSGGH
jgi:NADPH:quinone reductase-like Zn-dependent oxidoreductase